MTSTHQKKTILISDLQVEYITTKDNGYNSMLAYFKIVDKKMKLKMKPILSLEDGDLKMPYWKTEDGSVLIKVKDRCINTVDVLERGRTYVVDAEFESYSFKANNDGNLLNGFSVKLQSVEGGD